MKKLALLFIASFIALPFAQAQSEELTEAPVEVTMRTPAKPDASHGFKGSFGLGFSSAKYLAFDDASGKTKSGRVFQGSSQFDINSSYSLEAGLQNIPAEGWGYSAFLTYDARIKVTGYNDTYNNEKVAGTFGQEPLLDLMTLSGNMVYGMNRFYVPMGVNVTLPHYDSKLSMSSTDVGFGFQVGCGYFALDNLAFDILYKKRGFNLQEKFANGVAFNYGYGSLDGLALQGRLLF